MAGRSQVLALCFVCACAGSDPAAPPGGQPGRTGSTITSVADLSDPNQMFRWQAASGWVLSGARVVGDLTGDAVPDAVLQVTPAGAMAYETDTVLVTGPLRRAMTLPGDEFATFRRVQVHDAGDLGGDGVTDLVFNDTEHFYLVEGPFPAGDVDVTTTGARSELDVTSLSDIDGDGILDQVLPTPPPRHGFEVRWGPISRWSGPADLTVLPDCGDYDGLRAVPDVTGDGIREVYLQGETWRCPSWTFPLPSGGTYVPDQDPAARLDVPPYAVVADQTGDGQADAWWEGVVYAAPVTYDATGSLSAAETIRAATFAVQDLEPVPLDATGDGIADFVGHDADLVPDGVPMPGGDDGLTNDVLFVQPGGSALATTVPTTGWDVDGRRFSPGVGAFVESGVACILVEDATEIVVVELGPGASVE